MTNREWLVSLSDEELAKLLCESIAYCADCPGFVECTYPEDGKVSDERPIYTGLVEWLRADHKPKGETRVWETRDDFPTNWEVFPPVE